MRLWANNRGISTVSLLMGAALISASVLAISGLNNTHQKRVNTANVMVAMSSLESEFLAAMMNADNFQANAVRFALEDGSSFPPIELSTFTGNRLTELPSPSHQASDIRASEAYFTFDKNPCGSFAEANCQIKLEASLQLIAGQSHYFSPNGTPDWIGSSSAAQPVWAFAYRISLNPKLEQKMVNFGVQHNNPFTVADHIYPFPIDNYLRNDRGFRCDPGGIVVGFDSKKGRVKCVYPQDMCPSETSLAKQITVAADGIGVECVGWKSISCPDNYVIYEFNPSLLDGDATSSVGAGRCVYFGQDDQTFAEAGTTMVEKSCPSKYQMTAPSCRITSVITTPCSNAAGDTVNPYSGRVDFQTVSTTTGRCQEVQPAQICPAGYSGGRWTANIQFNGNCQILPSQKFVDLSVGGTSAP